MTPPDPGLIGGRRWIRARGATPVLFGELIEEAHYLVIQAPLTSQTQGLIREAELQRMKLEAVLINTARGPIVNDAALNRTLNEGWIAGAGLDDIPEEPAKQRDRKPVNPAVQPEQCDHYATCRVLLRVGDPHSARFAASEVVRVLTGKRPLLPVKAVQPAAGSSVTEGAAPTAC